MVSFNSNITLPCNIDQLNDIIATCHLCDLSKSRTQSMVGYGNMNANVMFIDSVVSPMQDKEHDYYVGNSAQLLKKMVENVLKLSIDDVYLTHAVKCVPITISKISLSQYNSCRSYLLKQIELIKPRVIVALGEDSYNALCQNEQKFNDVRGHILEFNKCKLIPIYHPNFLLRNPSLKKATFNDLKLIKSLL